ncbi:RCC1/BLIP-II [Testicularia cyperi]|uniref:RCC1/BLIP-II n=1 Tax=Testicularia cyperi TaxID=1882483 RepID=A0A317XMF1_9BASI|nr:RCC1/BLIP-II [Testicularia cyperi]
MVAPASIAARASAARGSSRIATVSSRPCLSPSIRTSRALHTARDSRASPSSSTAAASSSYRHQSSSRSGAAWTSAAIATGAILTSWYLSSPLHNDVAPSVATEADITATTLSQQDQMRQRAKLQGVYAWGSNRYNVVAPDAPSVTLVRSPRSIPFFDGVALRDINLQEKHGVAVDANGDVYQWGLGFFDPTVREMTAIEDVPLGRRRERNSANQQAPLGSLASQVLNPVKTLTGKNIIKVEATEDKVFALSKDGHVYVFSAVQQLQSPPASAAWSANPFTLFNAFASSTIDHEVLKPAPSARFGTKEKIHDIVAGNHHLLAVSNKGRTFSTPISEDGNNFGQLGSRRVLLNTLKTPDSKPGHVDAILEPRMFSELDDPNGRPVASLMPSNALPPVSTESGRTSKPTSSGESAAVPSVQTSTDHAPPPMPLTEPSASIRWCTTLHEIPALRNINVVQLAAGSEHSLARTWDGKVLAWGRHTHGQCGLGINFSMEAVPVPTEVVLSKSFSNSSTDIRASSIAAGADNSFFMTTRRDASGLGNGLKIDLLAVGKGQWGTLGNAMWSQVAAQPGRVKTVSGLMEYSEASGQTHPVPIYSMSVGKPGHVALVLDTVDVADHLAFGRDVMVWGHNAAFQLGTTKRSNLAVPQHLKPLPPLTTTPGAGIVSELDGLSPKPLPLAPAPTGHVDAKLREADINSGALTHMPHNRLQLASKTRADTRLPPQTPTASNTEKPKTKKNLTVEESIKAGTVSTVVFWKIQA